MAEPHPLSRGLLEHKSWHSNRGRNHASVNSPTDSMTAADFVNDPNNNVAYHIFWDSNADYPGLLSDGSDWSSGQAYKDAFG